ncbi:MAG: hypothetical protein HY755_02715 [Nitrospirae bacterium]|nr:hypothetical protein [Nitrospirota bacterium]
MSTKLNAATKFKTNQVKKSKEGNRTISDFWQWAYSDLTQNITRGVLAEFLVAWSLGLDGKARDPWQSYDLKTVKGKTVEVKSAADAQAWAYGNHPPKFIVKPTRGYDRQKGYGKDRKFQADIYVLAHLMGQDINKVNPIDTNHWRFWVLTKEELISLLGDRQSISVSMLQKAKESLSFSGLRKINEI